MKKVILTAIGILGIAACQKDYYLNDLQEAEREIAQLESINKAKQDIINNLEEVVDALYEDLAEANEYVIQLLDDLAYANGEITALETVVAIKVANIELLEGIVEEQEIKIDSLSNLTEVQATTIDSLNTEIVDFKESIVDFQSQVASLTADLEYLRENPVTIYVTRYATRVVTQIQYVEVEADGEDADDFIVEEVSLTVGNHSNDWVVNRIHGDNVFPYNSKTVTYTASSTVFTIEINPRNGKRFMETRTQAQIEDPNNWNWGVVGGVAQADPDVSGTVSASVGNLRFDADANDGRGQLLADVTITNTGEGADSVVVTPKDKIYMFEWDLDVSVTQVPTGVQLRLIGTGSANNSDGIGKDSLQFDFVNSEGVGVRILSAAFIVTVEGSHFTELGTNTILGTFTVTAGGRNQWSKDISITLD